MTLFIGSQSYISPPSFTFVSAAVSEIRELNQKKKKKKEKNSEIGYFQFNTFPGHHTVRCYCVYRDGPGLASIIVYLRMITFSLWCRGLLMLKRYLWLKNG